MNFEDDTLTIVPATPGFFLLELQHDPATDPATLQVRHVAQVPVVAWRITKEGSVLPLTPGDRGHYRWPRTTRAVLQPDGRVVRRHRCESFDSLADWFPAAKQQLIDEQRRDLEAAQSDQSEDEDA